MENLLRVRQRFIVVAAILTAISLALLVYLVWGGSSGPPPEVLQKQRDDLKLDVARWQKSNPDKTRADLKQLYSENLPSRMSQISQRVEKIMLDAGVTTASVHYPDSSSNGEKNTLPDVQEIRIETNVTGDYAKVARFINALEQEKMLFIIEKISLMGQQAQQGQPGGIVSLQITFSTFMKQATGAETTDRGM